MSSAGTGAGGKTGASPFCSAADPPRAPATPLADIECFILDMDGTVNLGETPIDGAHDFVETLRRRGTKFCFFTNNSSKSPEEYVTKLHRLGFRDIGRCDIMTSGDVMIDWLLARKERPRVYLAGTPALEEQFSEAGIELLSTDCSEADYAVLGFDTTFSFEKADCLCRLIRSGTPFVATNIDRVCPLEGDRVLPDCGSMAAMITHATGVEPLFVGKPSPTAVDYVLRHTGSAPHRTAIVGDRLYTDVRTALAAGIVGIAVLSGEVTRDEIEESSIVPHYVLDSVADIETALQGARSAQSTKPVSSCIPHG